MGTPQTNANLALSYCAPKITKGSFKDATENQERIVPKQLVKQGKLSTFARGKLQNIGEY